MQIHGETRYKLHQISQKIDIRHEKTDEFTDNGTTKAVYRKIGSIRICNAAGHSVVINSGYRSPQLNKKVGGVATSNHLTGCACDIRVSGMEQAIVYAAILIQYANESHQDFDELLIEKNRYGAIWLHFAVRPKDNRRKVQFIQV